MRRAVPQHRRPDRGAVHGVVRRRAAIRITSARTGRSVVAEVVDECDSRHGCRNNVVDTSRAVWDALGLDTDAGVVPVTWSDT